MTDIGAWLIGILFGFAIGFVCGVVVYDSYIKTEAIKHGVAQYRLVDETSNKVEFIWKDNK